MKKLTGERIDREIDKLMLRPDSFTAIKSFIHQELIRVLESLRMEERPASHYCPNFRNGDYRCIFCGEEDLNKPCKENPHNQAVQELNQKIDQLKKEVKG